MALKNAFENLSEEKTQEYEVAETLKLILSQLRIMNQHLELITEVNLDDASEYEGDD